LSVLRYRGVAAGIAAVTLVMACYAAFLVTLTLHLQSSLHFSPLDAGLVFAAYAIGFGITSMTWPSVGTRRGDALPFAGALVLASGLFALGIVAAGGSWPIALTTVLLFAAAPATPQHSARWPTGSRLSSTPRKKAT